MIIIFIVVAQCDTVSPYSVFAWCFNDGGFTYKFAVYSSAITHYNAENGGAKDWSYGKLDAPWKSFTLFVPIKVEYFGDTLFN